MTAVHAGPLTGFGPELQDPAWHRFSFVLISDRTGGARPGVFEQGLTVTDLLAPDFAIQLGDLIEGYSTDAGVIERQWDEMAVLTDGLRSPLVRVPGNHDVANPLQRDIWHRRFGPTWFHFRYDDVLFCVLDTQDPPELVADQPLFDLDLDVADSADSADPAAPPGRRGSSAYQRVWNGRQPGRLSAGQLAEWESVLSEHRDAAWTIVCMHMPLWQGDHPDWARFRAALGRRPYTAFAGHVHHYRHERIGSRSHVRLGPTGGMHVLGDPDGNVDHVTQVTMTPQGPVLANIVLDGVRDLEGRRVSAVRQPG